MLDQLSSFTQSNRVAREMGTEGKLGVQAEKGVAELRKDLTDSMSMGNLTDRYLLY